MYGYDNIDLSFFRYMLTFSSHVQCTCVRHWNLRSKQQVQNSVRSTSMSGYSTLTLPFCAFFISLSHVSPFPTGHRETRIQRSSRGGFQEREPEAGDWLHPDSRRHQVSHLQFCPDIQWCSRSSREAQRTGQPTTGFGFGLLGISTNHRSSPRASRQLSPHGCSLW